MSNRASSRQRSLKLARAVALAALAADLLLGCAKPPPPLAPVAPPPPAVVVAPPPPPKCERVEEGCVADASTRSHLKDPLWQFAPPPGWTYAQDEEIAIATSPSAWIAVSTVSRTDHKVEKSDRDAAFASTAERLAVTLPKRKQIWRKKPDDTQKVGELSVGLFQIDGAKRNDQKGSLLMFSAEISPTEMVVGGGFVLDEDANKADEAILQSIQSLERVAPTSDRPQPAVASDAAPSGPRSP